MLSSPSDAAPSSEPSPPAASNGDVKQRLTNMWNNVKYGKAAWSLGESAAVGGVTGNFSRNSAVWLLGQCYHKRDSEVANEEESAIRDGLGHN
jgi:hypothetical protein